MIAENTSADVIELDTDHAPQLSMTNELAQGSPTDSRCTHLQVPEGSQIGKIVLTLGKQFWTDSGTNLIAGAETVCFKYWELFLLSGNKGHTNVSYSLWA